MSAFFSILMALGLLDHPGPCVMLPILISATSSTLWSSALLQSSLLVHWRRVCISSITDVFTTAVYRIFQNVPAPNMESLNLGCPLTYNGLRICDHFPLYLMAFFPTYHMSTWKMRRFLGPTLHTLVGWTCLNLASFPKLHGLLWDNWHVHSYLASI
jgi:hypothetical protein